MNTVYMDKRLIMLGMTAGSFLGGYIPYLWGDTSGFDMSSVLFTAVGGFAGIWAMYRIQQ